MAWRRIATVALAAAGSLLLATPAYADDYNPPFHQQAQLPISASDFLGNADECANAPTDKDTWHFVLPEDTSHFKSLTATFDPGGPVTITSFGPPTDKHAYVYSAVGAKLTAVTALVGHDDGSDHVDFFTLSHTCSGTPPTTAPPTTAPPTTTTTTTTTTTAPPTCDVADQTCTTPVTTTSPPLPTTGVALTGVIVAGVALLMGGTALMLARRRRDAVTPPPAE